MAGIAHDYLAAFRQSQMPGRIGVNASAAKNMTDGHNCRPMVDAVDERSRKSTATGALSSAHAIPAEPSYLGKFSPRLSLHITNPCNRSAHWQMRIRCYRPAMRKDTAKIRFKATLSRPAEPKDATWSFLVLPKPASAQLPTRSMITVDGTLDGVPFQATLEPDGQGSHWLKVESHLRESVGAAVGATVELEIAPVAVEPEPTVPPDLHAALAADDCALATWNSITPLARRDWIHWITSGKKAETRARRITVACDKLAGGQRRACCFDRSGMYSKGGIGAPKAADASSTTRPNG